MNQVGMVGIGLIDETGYTAQVEFPFIVFFNNCVESILHLGTWLFVAIVQF